MPRKIFYKSTGKIVFENGNEMLFSNAGEKLRGVANVHGNGELAVDSPFSFGTLDGSHNCLALAYENEQRKSVGESPVSIFQDCENQSWNMRVGLEFVEMKFCGFCGSKLKC